MAYYNSPPHPSLDDPSSSPSWSMWRSTPLTPPMTSTFEQRKMHHPQVRVTTTLPPITHFDRHLPPLTPPDEEMSSSSSSEGSSSRLPPIQHHYYYPPPPEPSRVQDYSSYASSSKPFTPPDEPYFVDWFDVARTRSAHFIAEKTCEMICYLWFSSQPSSSPPAPQHSYPSPNPSNSPLLHRPSPNPATTTLQLIATPTFVSFMQKLLETTQVSQSVIVLSLHYIYRLKERNRYTAGQPGSEFRIAVAGLMMANKFLDDNTYTNKTWSEVSGIDLPEVNKMEREFLLGVDFNLYVDKSTYASWLNLLKGLVMAKERDSRQWRKSRGLARLNNRAAHPNLPATTGPASRTYSTSRTHRSTHHRARSTSPCHSTRSLSSYHHTQAPATHHQYSSANPDSSFSRSHLPSPPQPRSGSKRSAEDAFSPTSATFSQLPSKRPVSISLRIPDLDGLRHASHNNNSAGAGTPPNHSPLEGLQSFAKMSIVGSGTGSAAASPMMVARAGAGAVSRTPMEHNNHHPWTPASSSSSRKIESPTTLSAAYAVDEGSRSSAPQSLYYYSLSCSPMCDDTAYNAEDAESRWRKARLRCHQPASPSTYSAYYYPTTSTSTAGGQPVVSRRRVMDVQSASASPHEAHIGVGAGGPHHAVSLPHFGERFWNSRRSVTTVGTPTPTPSSTSGYRQQQQSAEYGHGHVYASQQHSQHPQSLHHQHHSQPPQHHQAQPPPQHHGHHHHHQHQHSPPQAPVQQESRPQPTQYASPIPSAPFNNAGPPGVHFYPTPVQQHQQQRVPSYAHTNTQAQWARARHY